MVDCIIFAGGKNAAGYGRRYVNGRYHLAHRLAYCEHHGVSLESIKGLEVRHECDNPPCINPNHLKLGTHDDNMKDKVARGRQCRGETIRTSKLTDEAVTYIRKNHRPFCKQNGTLALAVRFGVSKSTITRALTKELWAHVSVDSESRKIRKEAPKGVCFHRETGKWQARIKVNGKTRWLGLHGSIDEAKQAYDKVAAEVGR